LLHDASLIVLTTDLSAVQSTLLYVKIQNEQQTAVNLLLKLLEDGDSVARDTDRKVRHLQELFDDVEHLRTKVQRADEARIQAERSNHQLQARLEVKKQGHLLLWKVL
jgi:hypothetical protein